MAPESSECFSVFRHESGAEMTKRAVDYSAMHGTVRVEEHVRNNGIHLNSYYYKRIEQPSDKPSLKIDSPWPTMTLSRSELAELCDVTNREIAGKSFDYSGVKAGQLYTAYDAGSDSISRNMDTEKRVYAVPTHQTDLIDFPISHLSARPMTDGLYKIYGYNPDGPSAEENTI